MDDQLLPWLRTQIAEKRAHAEAASPGPWHANAEHDEVLAIDGITVCDGFALSNNQLRATVDFIADNDPAAVLSQCEAHTRILDLWQIGFDSVEVSRDTVLAGAARLRLGAYEKAVLALALAYQHNPGYQEAWR